MSPSTGNLQHILETSIQTLALTLRPSTVIGYRSAARRFLTYLRAHFPEVHQLSQLRRDPHLLGWFRSLSESQPPLCNKTRCSYLLALRRLCDDLAADGHPITPHLIRPQDFPPLPRYLPRALSPQDDHLLKQELRRTDDLHAHTLLLARFTGIRIGECLDLPLDCLRQIGPDCWALHVPLGKLHTERLVPAEDEVRQTVARILALRSSEALASASPALLLPRGSHRGAWYQRLCLALTKAAQRAGCGCHVTPHRLRHTFATEMVRLGLSLPALMQLLGHTDIRMTLRYVQITQLDLQREFHAAQRNAIQPHRMPLLSVPADSITTGLPAISQALAGLRHLLEMYRRQLGSENMRRKISRLDKRLLAIAAQIKKLDTAEE